MPAIWLRYPAQCTKGLLNRQIATFVLWDAAYTQYMPQAWEHPQYWTHRLVYATLRDAIEVETRIMKVFPEWAAASEYISDQYPESVTHVFQSAKSSLLDESYQYIGPYRRNGALCLHPTQTHIHEQLHGASTSNQAHCLSAFQEHCQSQLSRLPGKPPTDETRLDEAQSFLVYSWAQPNWSLYRPLQQNACVLWAMST